MLVGALCNKCTEFRGEIIVLHFPWLLRSQRIPLADLFRLGYCYTVYLLVLQCGVHED